MCDCVTPELLIFDVTVSMHDHVQSTHSKQECFSCSNTEQKCAVKQMLGAFCRVLAHVQTLPIFTTIYMVIQLVTPSVSLSVSVCLIQALSSIGMHFCFKTVKYHIKLSVCHPLISTRPRQNLYVVSCGSKPTCCHFFCGTQKENFIRIVTFGETNRLNFVNLRVSSRNENYVIIHSPSCYSILLQDFYSSLKNQLIFYLKWMIAKWFLSLHWNSTIPPVQSTKNVYFKKIVHI